MRSKVIARVGLVTAAIVAAGAVLFSTGQADAGTTKSGCRYPQVCLYRGYLNGSPTGRFVDVTGGWQHLTRSRGTTSYVNTRHHDVAYILTSGGSTVCLMPGDSGGIMPDAGTAVAVRITSRSRC